MIDARAPWLDPEAVQLGLSALEERLRGARDRRAVFATAYARMMAAVRRRRRDGMFEHPTWIDALMIRFAEYYRRAYVAFEDGEPVPNAWRVAFEVARDRRGLVIQDLLLGLNAHIVHDLPLALAEVGARPEYERDYLRVLDAVETAIDSIQLEVAKAYAPGLGLLDDLLWRADEWTTFLLIRHFRIRAWRKASTAEPCPRALDEESTRYADLILALTASRRVHRLLCAVEAFDARDVRLLRWLAIGVPGFAHVDHTRRRAWICAERRIHGASLDDVWPRLLASIPATTIVEHTPPRRLVAQRGHHRAEIELTCGSDGATVVRWTHEMPRRRALFKDAPHDFEVPTILFRARVAKERRYIVRSLNDLG